MVVSASPKRARYLGEPSCSLLSQVASERVEGMGGRSKARAAATDLCGDAVARQRDTFGYKLVCMSRKD